METLLAFAEANNLHAIRARSQTLYSMAGSWPTCACGQLCKDLPRSLGTKAPLDTKLNALGTLFSTALADMHQSCGLLNANAKGVAECLRHAIAIFHKIEKRTEVLLSRPAP